MLAVVKTGGKQYVVKPEMTLHVEKLPGEVGSSLTLPDVLLVASGDDGSGVTIATGASVGSVGTTIVEQGKEKKIRVIKFKPKVRYTRIHGHRQQFTKIRIESIQSNSL